MTEPSHWLDEFVETHIRGLLWTSNATEHDKDIVAGNLRHFTSALRDKIRRIEAERDAAQLVSRKRRELIERSGVLAETAKPGSPVNGS